MASALREEDLIGKSAVCLVILSQSVNVFEPSSETRELAFTVTDFQSTGKIFVGQRVFETTITFPEFNVAIEIYSPSSYAIPSTSGFMAAAMTPSSAAFQETFPRSEAWGTLIPENVLLPGAPTNKANPLTMSLVSKVELKKPYKGLNFVTIFCAQSELK